MKIVSTYMTFTALGTTRKIEGDTFEFYAPSLLPGRAALVTTWGVLEDGSELELSKVIIKR